MRLKVHEKVDGPSEPKKELIISHSSEETNEFEPTVSYREAWKALGKRRQYRSPPQSASSTPTNSQSMDLVTEFKAAVLGYKADQRPACSAEQGERQTHSKTPLQGESLLTLERPHISTLYFLAEMEKFK